MRDIKFRAWDKATNEMLFEWDTQGWGHDLLNPFEGANFTRMEIMQHVGLKDKNGKEIYEGDIVSFKSRFEGDEYSRWGEVVFGKATYDSGVYSTQGYYITRIKSNQEYYDDDEDGSSGWLFECEVIGNIYENPELLK